MTPLPRLRTGVLEVGGGRRLYWEESGATDGAPAIRLHGGPGSGLGAGGYRAVLIHERLDVSGPLGTAWEVHCQTTAQRAHRRRIRG